MQDMEIKGGIFPGKAIIVGHGKIAMLGGLGSHPVLGGRRGEIPHATRLWEPIGRRKGRAITDPALSIRQEGKAG